MPKINKLTVLGGGSTYTPELLGGLIERQDTLTVETVSLYDIHAERRDIVGGLIQRMFQRVSLPTRIELTQSLQQAIEGADFIVSQIRVGWMAARILDEHIPLSHNVLGQETVGAGGIFKAQRTIPVTLHFAQEVSRLAPNAWFLNFTNPSGMITEALLRYSPLQRVVGLCNVPINSQRALASLLKVAPEQVWLDWVGLNHLGWICKAEVDGKDYLPQILDELSHPSANKTHQHFPFKGELLQTLQLLPTYYLRYYYATPQVVEEFRKSGKTRGEVVAEIEQTLLAKYRDPGLDTKPAELSQRGGALYSEAALRLMHSLLTDQRDVQILIVRNAGAIPDLPQEVAVEVPAVVGAHGVTPLSRGSTPLPIKPLLEAVKTSEMLAIEAAVSGSRQKLIQALWANPLVPSFDMAEKLTDELLQAHRQYLPQYFAS